MHIGKNFFYVRYQKVAEALRIPKEFHFYNWKHTGAAIAALSGINLESIRQQLGHHSLDQVKEDSEAMIGDSTKEFRTQHKAI